MSTWPRLLDSIASEELARVEALVMKLQDLV